MNRGIYASAASMMASQHRQRLIANNLSNSHTVGYQSQKAHLSPFDQALIHRLNNSGGREALDVLNQGSRVSGVSTNRANGNLEATDRPTDLALDGPGYFQVETPEGMQLTRAGQFSVDDAGFLASPEGYRLVIEDGTGQVGNEAFTVTGEGVVRQDDVVLGRVQIVQADPAASVRGPAGYFEPPDGEPVADTMTEDVTVRQGWLERSNVDPVQEMTQLLATLRHYGLSHSALQIQDGSLDHLFRVLESF